MAQTQEHQLTELLCSLQNKSPSIRRKAIGNINNWLQKQNNNNDSDMLQIFESELSIPITNLILDQSESIRENALRLLLQISDKIACNLDMKYMNILIPAIWKQLGCYESMKIMMKFRNDNDENDDFKTLNLDETNQQKQECSEEVRKLMVELLTKIISANYNDFIIFCENNERKYCLLYLNILHLLFNDNCPEIRRMIARFLLNQINKYQQYKQDEENNKNIQNKGNNPLFQYIFDDYAEYLCLSLAKGCIHQRGKIRLISFELLSKIIQYNISIKKCISSWIADDEKIWKYISYLTFDQMQYIKTSLALNAFTWISLLRNNGNDANNVQHAKIWMLMLNEDGLNIFKQHNEFNAQYELLQCVSFIITLCTEKISHWKEMHRLFGIKALVSITLCLRSELSSKYVVTLLPHFINLIESDNDDIKIETNKCLKLFGEFIPIDDYSDFLFSKFNCNISIKPYLKISAQIFKGYNVKNVNETQLLQICKSISNSSFQQNIVDIVSTELLNATINLLNICKCHLNPESILEILWLIIQVHAGYLQIHHSLLSDLSIESSHQLHIQISNIIKLLNSDDVWQQYFKQLYQRIDFNDNNDDDNDDNNNNNCYYLFASLLFYSKTFITKYMDAILPVFQQCNDEQNTETIRYATLSILYWLLQDVTNIADWTNCIKTIVFEIVLPNVVWKPGKFRLNMRLLSLNCMLVLYKNKMVDPDITWNYRGKLISALTSRLDDFEYKIRWLAVQLFDYILSGLHSVRQNKSDPIITEQELKSLCQSILDRFDDSKDEIRILTCSTLKALVKCMDQQQNIDLYTNIIETSLIHLDDANENLQQTVFLFLKEISYFNQAIFDKQLKLVNTDNIQNKSQILMQQLSKITNS